MEPARASQVRRVCVVHLDIGLRCCLLLFLMSWHPSHRKMLKENQKHETTNSCLGPPSLTRIIFLTWVNLVNTPTRVTDNITGRPLFIWRGHGCRPIYTPNSSEKNRRPTQLNQLYCCPWLVMFIDMVRLFLRALRSSRPNSNTRSSSREFRIRVPFFL